MMSDLQLRELPREKSERQTRTMANELPSDSELCRDLNRLPRHVAIIMDGNGRWAKARDLARVEGHRAGAESVREVVRAARALNIQGLTLFAFSEQNWDRPAEEVSALMELLYRYIVEEREEIMDNGIRLTAVGDLDRLPKFVRKALDVLMDISSKNSEMVLCLALSYGGREDLTDATRKIANEVAKGTLKPEDIDEDVLNRRLSTRDMPPVDLMIRTSGEQRVSNFLLWQLAYAEMIFTETMWPDFRKEQFHQSVIEYQKRERRFGRISEQLDHE